MGAVKATGMEGGHTFYPSVEVPDLQTAPVSANGTERDGGGATLKVG